MHHQLQKYVQKTRRVLSRILQDFLSAAGVVHTNLYADNIFYSNPNRGNLLGLKQMLSHYGIETIGVRVADRDVNELSFPCILHVEDDFVVATQCNDTSIIYRQDGQKRKVEISAFHDLWDGYALIMRDKEQGARDEKKEEPHYQEHRQQMWMEQLPIWGVGLILCGMMVLGTAFSSLPSAALTLTAAIGVVFCVFLAEKEVTGTSRWGDKLCSALGEGDCAKKSTDGKLWGTLSLSEIGLGYFAAQILSLSLFPDAFVTLSAISVLALLFCPWSIVTQWKMKNWCALCLLVVGILIIQGGFSIYQLSNLTSSPSLGGVKEGFLPLVFYLLSILLAHLLVRGEHRKIAAHQWQWAFQSFRNDPIVFETKLKSHAPRKIEERDVTKQEGNPKAPHCLTVVTAAKCPHCQAMKPRIKQVAQHLEEKLYINYIILSDMTDEAKFEFIQRTGINGTPTLLVDGYDLPLGYEVEDLQLLLH